MAKYTLPTFKVIKYVRDNNKTPYGVLVGVKNSKEEVSVSYSLCRKGDRFKKNLGLKIAIERALKCNNEGQPLPRPFRKEIEHFNARVSKYFGVPKEEIWTW